MKSNCPPSPFLGSQYVSGPSAQGPGYWISVITHLAICIVAGWYIYLAIPYFVYPEYSIYATAYYENQGCPDFMTVLKNLSFFKGTGWYRPTVVQIVPFLVQSDLYNPRTIVASNISFFVLTVFLAPALFLSKKPLPTRVFSSLLLFCPTALMNSYFFPCPDALYILFSILFLYFIRKAYLLEEKVFSWAFWCAAVSFLLAITSKEIAVLAAFMAPFLLLLLPSIRWRRIIMLTMPFIVLSVLFYLAMLSRLDMNDPSYSPVPTLERLSRIGRMVGLVSNMKFSRSFEYLGWATAGYLKSSCVVWAMIWIGSIWAFVRTFRLWGWRKIVPAVVFAFLPLPAVGLLGGQAHHAFPILAALAVFIPLMWEASAGLPVPKLLAFKPYGVHGLVLGALCFGLLFTQARTADNLLTHWRLDHSLRYNTKLYQDDSFHRLAKREDVYFIVEECPDTWSTGCYIGVRPYLGRALRSGDEEYVKKWDPAMLPDLIANHPGKEIWLIKCRMWDPQPYVLRRLWPRK